MKRTIRLHTVLPYPPEKVWRALTEPDLLGSWFMKNDMKPVLNHYFTFRMAPQKGWDGVTHCEVIAVEPLKRLAYTYRGEATGEKALACAGIHSDAGDKNNERNFHRIRYGVKFHTGANLWWHPSFVGACWLQRIKTCYHKLYHANGVEKAIKKEVAESAGANGMRKSLFLYIYTCRYTCCP